MIHALTRPTNYIVPRVATTSQWPFPTHYLFSIVFLPEFAYVIWVWFRLKFDIIHFHLVEYWHDLLRKLDHLGNTYVFVFSFLI